MPDLRGLDNIALIVAFIVPGLVILFVRTQFITGRLPPANEAILPYLVMTLIYYGTAFPLLEYVSTLRETGWWRAVVWLFLVIIGPASLGVLLGVGAQKGLFRWLMQKLGMNPIHPHPTAWDWWFAKPCERWIVIVLKDGTMFGGYFGSNSFASSDPKERDVFIETIYVIESNGMWTNTGEKGLLVSQSEIRTLEFLPVKPQEPTDEQSAENGRAKRLPAFPAAEADHGGLQTKSPGGAPADKRIRRAEQPA